MTLPIQQLEYLDRVSNGAISRLIDDILRACEKEILQDIKFFPSFGASSCRDGFSDGAPLISVGPSGIGGEFQKEVRK